MYKYGTIVTGQIHWGSLFSEHGLSRVYESRARERGEYSLQNPSDLLSALVMHPTGALKGRDLTGNGRGIAKNFRRADY